MIAVVRLVAADPGIQPKEIANRLRDAVQTPSSDPRHMLHNLAAQLRRRVQVDSDENGGLFPLVQRPGGRV